MSLFQQYFKQKFSRGNDFRIKKFSSQKFDNKMIQAIDYEFQMDNLVEEITQDDQYMLGSDYNKLNDINQHS